MVISVSKRLRCPRGDVAKTALIPPSGAYLTWMEMLKEEKENEMRYKRKHKDKM